MQLGRQSQPHRHKPRQQDSDSPTTDEACIAFAETQEVHCYSSPADLVTSITGEPSPPLTPADLGNPEIISAIEEGLESNTDGSAGVGRTRAQRSTDVTALETSVITAIFYDETLNRGASLLMEAPSGCDANTDIDWSWSSLRSDWNNRIESGVGYSRCQFKVWDHPGYVGASYGWVSGADTFGAMNNATESVRMR